MAKHKLLLIFAFAALAKQAIASDFVFPKTQAADKVRDFLTLCDSNKASRYIDWVKVHASVDFQKQIPPEELAEYLLGFCQEVGGFRPIQSSHSSELSLKLLLQGKASQTWHGLSIELDPTFKIKSLNSEAPDIPESLLPQDLSDASLKKELEKLSHHLEKLGLFSGIAIIAKENKILAQATASYADREKKTRFGSGTRFTLASLGKMFTGVAIAQLIEQKKISYDDKIGKFFPNFANTSAREKVSVGMLLNHSSGLGDFLDKRPTNFFKTGYRKAEELLPLFEREDLLFEPGSSHSYSNAGFALLGAIVEKVSGVDFPSYLQNNIFKVAGMTRSDPNNIPFKLSDLVVPYSRNKRVEVDIGTPAGGTISTGEDLLRFASALRHGKLLQKDTLQELLRRRFVFGQHSLYGQTLFGHEGGYSGVSTSLSLFQNSPYTLIILENLDAGTSDYLSGYFSALVASKIKKGS